jgi:hypothetical protein
LDMGLTSFSDRLVKGLSFAANGTMYITVDAPNPILIYNGTTVDYFYKEIASHSVNNATSYWYAKQSVWGATTASPATNLTTNNLYFIGYDTLTASGAAAADRWNVLKMDMGATGARFY